MAGTDVDVRPAHHTDHKAVAGLLDVFLAQHHRLHPEAFRPAVIGFTPAIFQDWLMQPDGLHLVADMSSEIAGYVIASRSTPVPTDFMLSRRQVYVSLLVVAPGARRRGVGRALFQAVEDWAADYEAEVIGLNVMAENTTAQVFYAALGYDLANEYRVKTLRRVRRYEATR